MKHPDPLDVLIRWPDVIREDVRDALLPYVGIRRTTGELKFLQTVDNKDLLSMIHKLGNAAAIEVGLSQNYDHQLFAEEAEELANKIDNYNKNN